jgi:hypothetical protein
MRLVFSMVPLLSPLLVCSSCLATADAPEEVSPTEARSSRMGFEAWLSAACPDGQAVGIADAATGELVHATSCERVREEALADEPTRERLLAAYQEVVASPPSSPERDGEAQQPLTPVGGFVCGLIAAAPGAIFNLGPMGDAACHSPRLSYAEQSRCSNVTGGGSLVLGILCGLAAIFL